MSRTSDYLGGAAGPATYGKPPGGGLVSYPSEIYQSPLLDLTAVQLKIEIIPAKPGHIPLFLNFNWIIEAFAGTQTAAGSCNLGSNAAHNNYVASFGPPTNANINSITTVPNASFGVSSLVITANAVQRIVNAPVFLDIASGSTGTGGFVLKGKLAIRMIWTPAGGIS
jgi:hypothetical protein